MLSLVFILALALHLTTSNEMCYIKYKIPSKTVMIETKRNYTEPWEQNANAKCTEVCEETRKDMWKLKLHQTYECAGECTKFHLDLQGPKRDKICECGELQNDKDKNKNEFLDGIAEKGQEIYKDHKLQVETFEGLGTYEFGLTKTNFVKANCICKSRGKHLLILNSQAEADAIHKWWGELEPDRNSSFLLLGYTNFKNAKQFETVTGVRVEDTGYLVWGENQPDDLPNEDCLALHYDKTLHNTGCMRNGHYVCEGGD